MGTRKNRTADYGGLPLNVQAKALRQLVAIGRAFCFCRFSVGL